MNSTNLPTVIQKRRNLRGLVLLPPLALVFASIALVAAAPLAWGAGEIIDIPDWMPPLVGVIIALGGLLVGLTALRKTGRETHGDFEVFGLQIAFGVIMFIAGSAMMIALVFKLPDTDTYAQMITDDGTHITATGFFVMSVITAAANIGVVWVGAYLYSHAFANMEPNRISQRLPGEVDGVGELLRERR